MFLCLPAGAGAAALATDVSQYRTALTNNTTYVSEANSARTALASPREISVVVEISTGQTGVLVQHGGAVAHSYRVRVAAGNVVEVSEAGVTLLSVTLPGVGVVAHEYAILWTQHPDGASVRSELAVVRVDTEEWAHAQGTHTGTTPSGTDTLTIGAGHGGATAFSGGVAAFNAVRIGRRHHSGAEHQEDWVAERTPPASTEVRREAVLVPDRDTLDVTEDGTFCGPAHLWAGYAFQEHAARLVGPVVGVRVLSPPLEVGSGYDTYSTAWWRPPPGAATYRAAIAHLFYRPVPSGCNRLHVRVFVYQYSNAVDIATVRYRAYSIADLPVVGEVLPPIRWRSTAIVACSDDHAGLAVTGAWLDLGPVEPQIDAWGATWISVALQIDPLSLYLADTYAQVLAVTAEPYLEPPDDGALDVLVP